MKARVYLTPGQDVQIYTGKETVVISSLMVSREGGKRPSWYERAQEIEFDAKPLRKLYALVNGTPVKREKIEKQTSAFLATIGVDPNTLNSRVNPIKALTTQSLDGLD